MPMRRRSNPLRATAPTPATAIALFGTLALLSTTPGHSSRARRRHLPSTTHPQSELLTRSDSHIPGVSIWTSKRAATASSHRGRASRSRKGSDRDDLLSDGFLAKEEEREGALFDEVNLRMKRSERAGASDAGVEPPSTGARENQQDEDGYTGFLASEEDEDGKGNGDAAPGRLLEEGGGSDSEEDESEEHTDDDDDQSGEGGDDRDGGESSDDGSGESQSEDEEEDGMLRQQSSSSPWGAKAGLSTRILGNHHGDRAARSLARKYEQDEEACFARIKELWAEQTIHPMSPAEAGKIAERVREDQKKLMEGAPTEWSMAARAIAAAAPPSASQHGDTEAVGASTEGSDGGDGYQNHAGAREEGSAVMPDAASSASSVSVSSDHHDLLFRLLLAEMQGDGPAGGLNNRWIDRDALLQLRGAATLAHHPEYLRHTANLPRVTRGVRVVAPEATHSMQESLARSLSHSTGSKLMLLDRRAMELVRGRALSEGIPKDRLTSKRLTSALLELAREDNTPWLVFLMDKGSVVLKSRGMCQRITEELKDASSRVLFLLSTVSDPSVPGNLATGAEDESPMAQDGASGQDGSQAKKKFIFLQQHPPDGRGGGVNGPFFGGPSAPGQRGGGGGRSGGRGDGMPQGMPGLPIPQHVLDELFREAMKSMSQRTEDGDGRSGQNGLPSSTAGDGAKGGQQFPPELLEALGEALSGEDFKRTLDQIGKQLGKDMNQSFSIMFSTTTAPPPQNGKNNNNNDDENGSNSDDMEEDDLGENADNKVGGDEDNSQPWRKNAGGSVGGSPSGDNGSGSKGNMGGGGGAPPWQGSSSLTWLTNLRKGIMNSDEVPDGDNVNNGANDMDSSSIDKHASSQSYDMRRHRHTRNSGGGSAGEESGRRDLDSSTGGSSKPDGRRGVDIGPSSSEIRSFYGCFEDMALTPPRDAILKQHWDAWVKEDVEKHNTMQNRQALMTALRRNMLACPELKRLDPLLARHRLTDKETGEVVLSALKVELSKAAAAAAAAVAAISASTAATNSTCSSEEQESGGVVSPRGDVSEESPLQFAPRKTAKGRLIISRESMETAFATVCKAYVPRPGQPMSRTREEVTALAQHDRHEQALVSNVILPKDIGVTYDMIGGLGPAKELLRQCITYPLRFPHLYSEGIAKEAVKGVLLFGPPGTGKTMLAKAVATEGGATFLSVDASVIENKWLGESEKNARAVFTLARRLAPCVVFIDEVDSVLSSREKYDDTSHGTLTSVKTTLMQEWDGLRTGGDRVVVIASTNRPFDLDEAVLRRLPRRILVDLPDAETREEILKVSMAQNRIDSSVNFTAITEKLEGFTGSDIKEVCREAVVRIAHEKAHELDTAGVGPGQEIDFTAQLRPVTMEDFWEARKKLTASVSDKGRELARVWEWNEEYGEVKKKRSDASAHHLSMYL